MQEYNIVVFLQWRIQEYDHTITQEYENAIVLVFSSTRIRKYENMVMEIYGTSDYIMQLQKQPPYISESLRGQIRISRRLVIVL